MTLHVEEQVLRFYVTMGHALAMEVGDPRQDLLETALDLARGHPAALDGRIQVTTGAELHDLAPMLVLILDEVDGLDDIHVVQRRRYAELGREFLDILLLCLVLSPLAELLQHKTTHGQQPPSQHYL